MTNSLAIMIGIAIALASVFDIFAFGGENLIFLGRKFNELIEWLAFWR